MSTDAKTVSISIAEQAWRLFVYAWIALSLAVPSVLIASTFVENGELDISAWERIFGSDGDTEAGATAGITEERGLWSRLIPNTTIAVSTAVACVLLLATPLAWFLFRTRLVAGRLSLFLIVLLALIPFYITCSTTIDIFGYSTLRHSALAVGAIHAIAYLPIALLLIGSAFQSVPRAQEEIAEVEGIPFSGRVKLALRNAVPALLASALLVTLWVATDYTASNLLLVTTYAETILEQFSLYDRPEEATVVGLPLFLVLVPLFWCLAVPCLRRIELSNAPAKRLPLAGARWPLSISILLLALALTAGPVAFIASKLAGEKPLTHFVSVFSDEIITSTWTALTAGLIAAVCGNYLAWRLVRARHNVGIRLWIVVALILPPPLVGIGLIEIFNNDVLGAIYDSPFIYVIAYVVRFLPVTTVLALPAIRAVPRSLEEAALTEGCSETHAWLRVTVPSCRRNIAVLVLVAMALSVGELPASNLLMPPGYSTVGPRFFSLVHYGLIGQAAALATISIAIVVIVWVAISLLAKRSLAK